MYDFVRMTGGEDVEAVKMDVGRKRRHRAHAGVGCFGGVMVSDGSGASSDSLVQQSQAHLLAGIEAQCRSLVGVLVHEAIGHGAGVIGASFEGKVDIQNSVLAGNI